MSASDNFHLCISVLGTIFLGYLGHRAVQHLTYDPAKDSAATKIQRVWRGHSAIARGPLLGRALFEQAKAYVDTPSNFRGEPTASAGKTTVYLPRGLDVVLKKSGTPQNQVRWKQMYQARELCQKNGYTKLKIPQARPYLNYIIESRLPIAPHRTKQQIGLYIENRDRFTEAVKEFTGFLCQAEFSDISGNTYDPFNTLSETPLGRYDNIALYLEGDEGKLALVDLERFEPIPDKTRPIEAYTCFTKCQDAVRLFPHHLEEIISVAKKFNPGIEAYRKELEKERDGALERFDLAYVQHSDFACKKGITIQNPTAFERLSEEKVPQLQRAVEKALREEDKEGSFNKGCLGADPEQTLTRFNEESFPKILEATYKLIEDLLEFNRSDECVGSISSTAELLTLRTLMFGPSYVLYEEFKDSITSILDVLTPSISESRINRSVMLSYLLDTILNLLVDEKVIAYYNPDFGYGAQAVKCIFC